MLKKLLFSGLLVGALSAQAAMVPEGTKLAEVQELYRGNGAEPATLDPNKMSGVPASNIARDLFEGLIIQDGKGAPKMGQAESYTVSKDNKTFTFKLKKGLKWSDGQPLTANDFVYSYRRVVDPKTASDYSWYMIEAAILNAEDIVAGKMKPETLGVKAIDDHTLEFTLNKPLPYFAKMLAHVTMSPVPRHVIEKYGDKWTRSGNMVSNGAYKLSNWVVNEKIELVRNPNYWDNENTVINKVTFYGIAENAQLNRYRANEIDITNAIPSTHFKNLQKTMADQVVTPNYLGTYYYEFNTKRKPFDNKEIRKALSYAVNRQAITQGVLQNMGQKPSYTLTPPTVDGFTPPTIGYSKMSQKDREAEAKRILESAGYTKSNPLKFDLLYNTQDDNKKIAVAVQQMWKQFNVEATLVNKEWKTYLADRNEQKFDVARGGWIGDYNEASTMLAIKTSGHGNNHDKYYNKEYDALMKKANLASTDEERAAFYTKAEEVLAEDMPLINIYSYVKDALVKPNVKGYPVGNIEGNIYSKDIYKVEL
ncbi:oligopeptide ABC transporter substrate-binding protein OppA [Flavobacteriaceae bacterium (ex Bugula neritina AB1)]|nr:oligopeptide ABC transporter substrate-binding protein OppA [Flavobacteriaceae bacterium (ex Bugula neritina AB1)]